MGVKCNTGIKHYDYKGCAWATRLKLLLNSLVPSSLIHGATEGDLVRIHNMAIGVDQTRKRGRGYWNLTCYRRKFSDRISSW